jgi:hypothetical protein
VSHNRLLLGAALALALPALAGCGYDYMQRTDRVGFSQGNAVKANLERETTDPSKAASYSTKGLGKNGRVIPDNDYTGNNSGGGNSP